MSSWYSNLVTKTSSQISSLRSTLLSSEADGDTEDDTHVCRVLRNYYSEKGRPSPSWLPPDPKAATQAPQTLYAQPQVGSRYGGLGGPAGQQPGAGGLSSLWDNNAAQGQGQQPKMQSLRTGRPAAAPVQQLLQQQPQPGGRDELLGRSASSGPRTGSYQSTGSQGQAGGGSAQDRLKQRLWGTRTTSPSSQNSQGPFQPPPSGAPAPAPAPVGGGGGGGYSGNYEDRFAPGGAYDGSRGGGSGYGGAPDNRPYLGANAPWSNNDGFSDFSGGGGGGNGGGGGARQGLPSNGPRRQGLPSGPRAYR